MRLLWAVVTGLLLGGGAAWWLGREPAEANTLKQQRAQQAAAQQAREARPSLYRWRDGAGVLQITEKPPQGGQPYERIDKQPRPGIEVRGD